MTKHELLTKCIAAYEDAIQNMPDNGWWKYLDEKCLIIGVCYFIESTIHCSLFTEIDMGFINKYKNESDYWFHVPANCFSATEAKETLEYRLNILKQELSITPQ